MSLFTNMVAEIARAGATGKMSDTPSTDAEIKRLEAALREIAKGKGEFSRDPLEHATNTIENMKRIAREALDVR